MLAFGDCLETVGVCVSFSDDIVSVPPRWLSESETCLLLSQVAVEAFKTMVKKKEMRSVNYTKYVKI